MACSGAICGIDRSAARAIEAELRNTLVFA
jgi:hypothetical protein